MTITKLTAGALLAASFMAPAAMAEEFITIGTGGVTGVYYPTGGAICRLVNKGRKEHGIRCSVESTGGSVYNINTIREGELEFGVAQSDWQHHAFHAKCLGVEVDHIGIGRGGLNRQVAAQGGMVACRIVQQTGIGEDNSICAAGFSIGYGAVPDRLVPGAGECVDRNQDFGAACMGKGDSLTHFCPVKVQAGKVAGVCFVVEATIDRMGAGLYGSAQ